MLLCFTFFPLYLILSLFSVSASVSLFLFLYVAFFLWLVLSFLSASVCHASLSDWTGLKVFFGMVGWCTKNYLARESWEIVKSAGGMGQQNEYSLKVFEKSNIFLFDAQVISHLYVIILSTCLKVTNKAKQINDQICLLNNFT